MQRESTHLTKHHKLESKGACFAQLYADAFAWRDAPSECNFLQAVAHRHLARPLETVLEIASGPGKHARYFGQMDAIRAYGLDASQSMVQYARHCAELEESTAAFILQDMRGFNISENVDLAFCLMDSIAYVTTDEGFLAHLDSVARNLKPGGLYVIETNHPKSAFSDNFTKCPEWSVQLDNRIVKMEWGSPADPFDPVSQIRTTTVRLTEIADAKQRQVVERFAQRFYLLNELRCLIREHAQFEVMDTFGDLNLETPLKDDKRASNLVLVLQKKDERDAKRCASVQSGSPPRLAPTAWLRERNIDWETQCEYHFAVPPNAADEIYVQDDLVSDADCQKLRDIYHEYVPQETWQVSNVLDEPIVWVHHIPSQSPAREFIDSIQRRVLEVLRDEFGFPDLVFDNSVLSRMKSGDKMIEHADNADYLCPVHGDHKWSDAPCTAGKWVPLEERWWRDVSALLYFGQDVEGGELSFGQHDHTISPQNGRLVAFPSNRYFLHRVYPVRGGERFSMSSWLTRDQQRARAHLR